MKRGGAPAHEVRIVGGRLKRSKLPVPDRPGLRPTPDRVRETLFNWLGQDLAGWRVVDAFAGSGALGFEAASRGAAEVLLLENDAALVKLLNASRERLGVQATLRVERADALAWMARAPQRAFDLVLLDPPFEAELFAPALRAAAPLLRPGGFAYLEAPQAFAPDPGLVLHRHLRAGAVHAHLFRREEPGAAATEGSGAAATLAP